MNKIIKALIYILTPSVNNQESNAVETALNEGWSHFVYPYLRQVYQDTMRESWERNYDKGVESVGIGISQRHDSLVLGAWGCGAFGNPPVQMAQLFKDVLEESEFKGMFRDIRFAIIEDHNSKGRNYESFKRIIDHQ